MSFLIDVGTKNPRLTAEGVPADMQGLVKHLMSCHECAANYGLAELMARRHIAQLEAEAREKQQGGNTP